ncbi:hypothetical protein BaRGS_00010554 [Batillaria attramentaria]|uniref:Alpha 1,4-glycosyltransferase domain-containing protein n=1 Tax=Batillaria attramentaria TaxID=370345 RepID=A0ABD0LH57_9CAEN
MRLSRIKKLIKLFRRKKVLVLLASAVVLYCLLDLPLAREPTVPSTTITKTKDRSFTQRSAKVWLHARPLSELRDNVVPNLVFFVWCQNRTFTFQDYLSVLSAWKLLEPDSLEVHKGTDVQEDKYNSWLSALNRSIPSFVVSKIAGNSDERCQRQLQYASEVLSDRGGVYLNLSTVLTTPIHHLRRFNFSLGFEQNGDISFISSQRKEPDLKRIVSDVSETASLLQSSGKGVFTCPSVYTSSAQGLRIDSPRTRLLCLTLTATLSLKPLDLNRIEMQELRVVKDLYYDDDFEDDQERNISKSSIPNIVHYVWFGSSELTFRMYLSVLSTLHIAQVDEVFIHSDNYLRGYYWRKVSSNPKVTVVYREGPRQIFGHRILYTQHRSDIVRADVLDKYGGVYMDWDVLWLRSPSDLLASGHDAIVNFDHMPRPPYPDTINLGVLMAKPRSAFVRLWRQELRHYRSKDFFHNALEMPYKVYERHPDSVHIDRRLQVMCFWLKCHPTFHPDFKNWQQDQAFDWRTDVYSIHFTHPDPKEFDSVVDLLNGNGTFADIGKFILRRAGELD